MHHRSDSSLPAPPVVPPPLPDERLSARTHHRGADSLQRYLIRDVSIGILFLLVGLLAGQVGWLAPHDCGADAVDLSMQRPQLAELSGVALSSPSARAGCNIATSAADQSVAAVTAPQQSAATIGSQARVELAVKSAVVSTPTVCLPADRLSGGIAPPDKLAIDAARQSISDAGPPLTELRREKVTELRWGIRQPSQLESPPELPSPSSLLHPAMEQQTCSARPMPALGTALNWADKPEDAYRLAAEQQKLVFLIHVSGNFAIPGYT